MINIDWSIVTNIIAPTIALFFGYILNYFCSSRKRLVCYYGNIGVFTLKINNTVVHTHSVIISNTGHRPIENIRLGHDVFPDNIDIYPALDYKIVNMPNNSKDILIPKLVGKEQVTISYLYFPPVTYDNINTYIKSDSGYAKKIDTIIVAKVPKWLIFVIYTLMGIGIITLFYLGYNFLIKV